MWHRGEDAGSGFTYSGFPSLPCPPPVMRPWMSLCCRFPTCKMGPQMRAPLRELWWERSGLVRERDPQCADRCFHPELQCLGVSPRPALLWPLGALRGHCDSPSSSQILTAR